MSRALLLVLFLSGALAGCERPAPKPAPAVAQPVIADAPAQGDAAPLPSVPADIASTPARRKPVRTKPADDNAPVQSRDTDERDTDERDRSDAFADEDMGNDVPLAADAEMDMQSPRRALTSSWNGLGDADFGMQVDAVREAWSGELEGDESDECFYLSAQMDRPSPAPALMFEQGRLVRYDVDTAALSAPGGGRVGMDADEIIERYGDDIERVPHKYTDGEYLRIENGDSVLLFETDEDGVVTEWRVGVAPQVDYVEGCS